jgi:hypothetical protein
VAYARKGADGMIDRRAAWLRPASPPAALVRQSEDCAALSRGWTLGPGARVGGIGAAGAAPGPFSGGRRRSCRRPSRESRARFRPPDR